MSDKMLTESPRNTHQIFIPGQPTLEEKPKYDQNRYERKDLLAKAANPVKIPTAIQPPIVPQETLTTPPVPVEVPQQQVKDIKLSTNQIEPGLLGKLKRSLFNRG